MKVFTRYLTLGIITALALYGCNIGGTATPTPPPVAIIGPASGNVASVNLTVMALNGSTVFNTVGQVINYSYTVTNIGSPALAGPVVVTDDKTTPPACAAVTSVGNLDNNLDANLESILCVSSYSITQNDLNAGSVVSNATAQIAGISSNRFTTTVQMASNKVLIVTVTPSTTTYTAAGQVIMYTYSVKNNGATTLTPATQFVVTDNRIPTPINCDVPKELAPGASLTCTANYTVTQNDMSAANITNSVTAAGGGATTAQPATSTVTRGTAPSGNFTKNSNISHTVVSGEWLYQIARCYGADIKATLAANPQIPNLHLILPAMIVSVPNIGSTGRPIYGPPCVGFYVVQVGDTWENIGTRFNADVTVLKAANRTIASPSSGNCLKIPLNSAGGATPAQQAASACPSSGTSPSTGPATIRVTIPPGATSVTLTGIVQASSKVRYVFAATQGQTLTVRILNAPANELTMGIVASNGTTMKAQDSTLTFTGTIPSTGDSYIEVAAVSGTNSKTFTLEVTITSPVVPSSPFERAADVNPGANPSDPAYLAVFNGQLFFRATGNNNLGAELWRYDPTTKTATLAKDINVGPTGSDPAFLTVFNGALYFRANGNDGAGVELWRWNGNDAGRLTDINPLAGDANPSYLAVFNNKLYFSAKGSEGVELYMTDGTSTDIAANINAGTGDSNPAYLTVFNNSLYFSAVSTDGKGVELYKYDGTNPPTRITDINPDLGNSNPAHLAVFNGALYFSAISNDNKGIELYKYDGTNAPTRVTDINPDAGDAAPSFLTVFNGALYFSAISNDGKGIELYKYDGTTAKLVGDLNTAGNASPSYLVVFNNELYFSANGNDNTGTEIWKFKGP